MPKRTLTLDMIESIVIDFADKPEVLKEVADVEVPTTTRLFINGLPVERINFKLKSEE